MTIKEDHSLKSLNTFHIDVQSKYFIEINEEKDIQELLADEKWKAEKKLILGGGSNILFSGDYEGLILKNKIEGIELIGETEDFAKVKIGAGVNWHELVKYALSQNWYGLENLALIPGTVGAAPIQNIGAYGMELKDFFVSLKGIDLETGEPRVFEKEECDFGYRNSIFKRHFKNKLFVVEVILKLHKRPLINVRYRALQEYFEGKKLTDIHPEEVFDAVVSIRQSKLPDPDKIGNGGSFFKNPVLSERYFEKLREKHPEIPFYSEENGKVKIPAAHLIQSCGWKGYQKGDSGVHKNQALVLVNYGHASGKEIVALAEKIQKSVMDKFHIRLEPEVNII